MWFADYLLAAVALLGHLALWVIAYNRLHATAVPCRAVDVIEKMIAVVVAAIPTGYGVWLYRSGSGLVSRAWRFPSDVVPLLYLVVCVGAAVGITVSWLYRRLHERTPAALRSNHTRVVDVRAQLGERPVAGTAKFWARVPGNQILRLDVDTKDFEMSRLPAALDGLSITHFFRLALHRAVDEAVL